MTVNDPKREDSESSLNDFVASVVVWGTAVMAIVIAAAQIAQALHQIDATFRGKEGGDKGKETGRDLM